MFGSSHQDKTVVTVEQKNAPAVASSTTSASSTASNVASNIANTASSMLNKLTHPTTTSTTTATTTAATSNLPTVTRTAETVISSASAPVPTKEYTEFVQLPKVVENTQVQTQYTAQSVQEETIKLKQQPIQVIEQPSVIKTQPIITHKQVVEVEQERPIEMIKKTVGYETLPAIEKKEVLIQPVRAVDQGVSVVTKQVVENGQTVTYEVRGAAGDIKVLDSLNVNSVSSEQGVIDRVKESLGGVRQNAYDARDVVPGQAVNALHTGVAQPGYVSNVSSSNSTTTTTSTAAPGVVGRAVEAGKHTAQNLLEVAREKASEVLHHDSKVPATSSVMGNKTFAAGQETKVTIDAPAGSVVKQVQ